MDILIPSHTWKPLSKVRPCRSVGKLVSTLPLALMLVVLVAAGAGASRQPAHTTSTDAALGATTTVAHPVRSAARSIPKHLQARSLKKQTKKSAIILTTKKRAENITNEISDALPERLESEIKKYFGLRYRMGGSGRTGIDCSALTRKVYADVFGIDLPRNSTQQSRAPMMNVVAGKDLRTGDLLFFGPKRKRVNHVGIYLSGGYFLHAARTAGVTISRLDSNYWKSRWMLSKRIKDLPADRAEVGGQDLSRVLEQFSLGLAFAGDGSAQRINFLNSGIQFNQSSEFRLSAAYKQNFNPSPLYGVGRSPLSLRQPLYPVETESHFRLSAVLSPLPLQGFKLIPSITQIVDTQACLETQSLGLETWMLLPSSGVALFMGAQAKNREDLLQRPLKMTPDWQTLDFSLGVHYRFSKALRFSLLGTHSYDAKPGSNIDPRKVTPLLNDISFKLDYRF